ncbi:transmembrane protein, putative [Medicago truncatula]|uniref:Transmembrane protein, putative n=1 Tax=Medicago truncatula TaxID=3880 RepID=G7IY29_MEDTR|nr:transmembrane protein, putative [Medicago truncatula]
MVGDVTLTGSSDISKHFVNHFKNLFNNNSHIQNNGMVEEVIPSNYRPIAIANFKFNFSSSLGMGRITGKYMEVKDGDGEGETRPHPTSLPCLQTQQTIPIIMMTTMVATLGTIYLNCAN